MEDVAVAEAQASGAGRERALGGSGQAGAGEAERGPVKLARAGCRGRRRTRRLPHATVVETASGERC